MATTLVTSAHLPNAPQSLDTACTSGVHGPPMDVLPITAALTTNGQQDERDLTIVDVGDDIINSISANSPIVGIASNNIAPSIYGPPCVLNIPQNAPSYIAARWNLLVQYQVLGKGFGLAVEDWLAYEASGELKVRGEFIACLIY
jgi:hypothetical protein